MSQSSVCRRGPLGIAVLTTVLALACSGAAPAVAPPVPAPRVAARVIDQVPSDTPYAMAMDQTMLSATTFEMTVMRTMIETELRKAVLTPAAAATASTSDRLGSEVARELLPFDDAALRRVGWLPGESELVLYGDGLIPVLRLRADGRAALAAWRRVSARAGVKVPESSWRGVPYLQILPQGKRTQTIVVAFLPRQVAITLALRPDAILDHLIDEVPAADPLLPRWRRAHIDAERPAEPSPLMWVNASAAAPRLRDGLDLAQLGEVLAPACRRAAAEAVVGLPPFSVMYWRDDEEFVASYAIPLPAALRSVVGEGHAAVHWLADARPGVQLAWGVPADELVAGVRGLVAPIFAALRACGKPAPDELAAFDALPLRQLRGGAAALEVTDGTAAAVVALTALDVGALWSWLQRVLPLGTFPRPGEIRAVPLMPGQTMFVLATSREIGLSLGWPEASRLQALLASGGHPAAVVVDYDTTAVAGAKFLGWTMNGDGATPAWIRLIFDERGLVVRSRMPRPPGWR